MYVVFIPNRIFRCYKFLTNFLQVQHVFVEISQLMCKRMSWKILEFGPFFKNIDVFLTCKKILQLTLIIFWKYSTIVNPGSKIYQLQVFIFWQYLRVLKSRLNCLSEKDQSLIVLHSFLEINYLPLFRYNESILNAYELSISKTCNIT